MNRKNRQRLIAATALAALLAGGSALAAAPQQRGDGHDRQARKEHRQDQRQDRKDQRQERREDRREASHDRRDDRREDRQDRRDDRREWRQDQRSDRQDWRRDRRDDRQDARRDAQRRAAYARYRQDYERRMHNHVQVRIVPRYYVRPAHYRYSYGGRWYTTSNYGAEMLRIAVQNGYREGLRAGRADRFDSFPGGFRDSFVWQDAAYGWGPGYIGRAEYSYYFRQGFERGYQDGYYGNMRYGRYAGGDVIIIEAVLGAILNLQMMR